MPPKSTWKKSRKPSMKRAKQMVTKERKAKAKRNMDTFFLKTKTLYNIGFTQGVSVSNYFYWGSTLNPTGVAASYLKNAEFLLYSQQYDKFRVNSVTVRVKPKANFLSLDQAQNDSAFTLSGDGLIHTCIDRDDTAPSNKDIISRYPSYKAYSVLKPFTRTYAIKYPTGVWIDCQSPATFTMAKELGLVGGITMYAENILEDSGELYNEPWAEITVEYNIVFQGKSSTNLTATFDETGRVTGVTLVAPSLVERLELTEPLETHGQLVPPPPAV